MKILEFESVNGMPIGVMPQKLAAFREVQLQNGL